MARKICDYSVIHDGEVQLGTDIDREFRFSTGPGLVDNSAILGLRAVNTGPGRFRFTARINGENIGTFEANNDALVTMHEVFPGSVLKEDNNELTLTKQASNGSSGLISDVVLWWQREVG